MPYSFTGGSDSKASVCNVRQSGFNPWVGKIPWRRKWQPTPVFLPGESHGQRDLVSYSLWGHKESDTTEWLTHTHTHTHTHAAWGISVLWLHIEPGPQQWKPGILTTRSPRNSPKETFSVTLRIERAGLVWCLLRLELWDYTKQSWDPYYQTLETLALHVRQESLNNVPQ